MRYSLFKIGAAILAAAVGIGANGAESLVKNAGFDIIKGKVAEGWGAAGATYSFVEGEGRNGTSAIRFDVKADSPYVFPSQEVKLTPGKRYLVEGWMRTEGDNVRAAFALEWRKKDGSWGDGRYVSGIRGIKAYTKFKIVVDLPTNAGVCTLSPFVEKGTFGSAWFDDFSIVPFEGPVLGKLTTSAYRNVAAKGEVTATSIILMRPEVRKEKSVKGEFVMHGANGKSLTLPAKIEGAYARAKFEVEQLPMGSSEITFLLKDGQGKILGKNRAKFERVEKLPDWKVRIEGTLTMVNGNPFYPIGVFMNRITKDRLERVKQGAFNCVMPYSPPTKAEMDLAHEMGLKVIYSIKDAYFGTRACVKEITSGESELKWVRDHVNAFKNHPALLAWYINDELSIDLYDRLAARRDLVAELDPDHPTYVALYQIDDFPAYVGTFDIFGGDPYPICQTGNPAISQVTEHTRLAREATCGGAMWQIPQLFDWGAYRVVDVKKTRPPTFDEFRNMAWQFVVEGAMGLVPYSIDSLPKMEWRDPSAIQWQKHCAISHEIAAYASAFLSTEAGPKVSGVPEGVGARSWHANDRDYVLLVNTTREIVNTTIEVAGHGKQPLTLGPIGVEMKELRTK